MKKSEIHSLIDLNRQGSIDTLIELVKQPSVGSDYNATKKCAEVLKDIMISYGIDSQVYETEGNPIVYGEVKAANKDTKTVLFYGHYDVQPPEPLDEWITPPFEPEIRNNRLYGRGAGDNKGQLLAHVLAVKAILEKEGSVPINIKFVFEGEEEMGSGSLGTFVEKNKELLDADVVITSDGPIHDSGVYFVVFGVRGVMNFKLELTTATTDNHSGNKGGVIPNSAWLLNDVLSSMKDDNDFVLIEGFYDDVIKPTESEFGLIDNLPYNPESLAKVYGVEKITLDKKSYYERLMFLPTLTINGLASGYTGEATKNIIPRKAIANMEVRMVKDQNPDDLLEKIRKHVNKVNPNVIVTKQKEDMLPSRTSSELEVSKKVIEAVKKAHNIDPIVLPSMGASLPDFIWTKVLGKPSIMVPYANADEANHAPNENMDLDCYMHGIHCTVEIIDGLSK